eukprot:9082239-Pyramimonas_sp.AAC.1
MTPSVISGSDARAIRPTSREKLRRPHHNRQLDRPGPGRAAPAPRLAPEALLQHLQFSTRFLEFLDGRDADVVANWLQCAHLCQHPRDCCCVINVKSCICRSGSHSTIGCTSRQCLLALAR